IGLCLKISEFDPFLYRGGFMLTALSTALLIAASVHRKGRLVQAVLGCGVLRWVGLRSYGIYLWHWPIFMLTRPQLDTTLDGLPLLAMRFALTLVLAELSFRLVETPIRSGALERSWQRFQHAQGRQRRVLAFRWAAALIAIVAGSIVLGSSVVRAQPPAPPAYLMASVAPSAAQVQAIPGDGSTKPQPTPTATSALAAAAITPTEPMATVPAAGPTTPVEPPLAPAETPVATATIVPKAADNNEEPEALRAAHRPTPAITTPTPTVAPTITATATTTPTYHITAFGDSVMQGAAPILQQVFPGIEVDAEKGRQVYRPPVDAFLAQLQEAKEGGRLAEIVVLHLGNNGVYPKESFDRIMQVLADRRLVIVFNVRVPRAWEDNNNRVIGEGVKRYRNAVLIDWYELTAKRPELFWNDGHHLKPEGALYYASLIQEAIARYADARIRPTPQVGE
ncbi:MAG: hypothetical protein ACP5UQ_16110, partial [Anaerolineae bacterium]